MKPAAHTNRAPVRLVGRDLVEFRFDPALWGPRRPTEVRLTGSFSAWDPRYVLRRSWGRWTLVLPRASVDVPGNSGEPEFRFVADGQWLACPDLSDWPRVGSNAIVPLRPVPALRREANHQTARRMKTTLDEYADTGALANFRAVVPGRLFRSYHPFLASRQTPVEGPRLQAAARLLESEGVGAVINLTDGPGVLDHPDLPPAYGALAARGAVLFAETSYEDAYYRPDGPDFGRVLGKILAFVADQPGPYLVHCRLGMDRTGVVTAFLAGLGGLPWQALVDDYLRSNDLGIEEYRDEGLLAFSFTRMLGVGPSTVDDLAGRLAAFATRQGVAPETVAQARDHLTPQRRPFP